MSMRSIAPPSHFFSLSHQSRSRPRRRAVSREISYPNKIFLENPRRASRFLPQERTKRPKGPFGSISGDGESGAAGLDERKADVCPTTKRRYVDLPLAHHGVDKKLLNIILHEVGIQVLGTYDQARFYEVATRREYFLVQHQVYTCSEHCVMSNPAQQLVRNFYFLTNVSYEVGMVVHVLRQTIRDVGLSL